MAYRKNDYEIIIRTITCSPKFKVTITEKFLSCRPMYFIILVMLWNAVKTPHTRKDGFEQTAQTQCRLLLKEQYDQDLHCLPFHLYFLNILLHHEFKLSHFQDCLGVPVLRIFTVLMFLFSFYPRELLDLIRRTASSGESNSVLVIGPRGSGKSLVILYELHNRET